MELPYSQKYYKTEGDVINKGYSKGYNISPNSTSNIIK